MIVGILKEPQSETRVSLLPEAVSQLVKKGFTVLVESNAGNTSSAYNDDYERSGAKIVAAGELVSSADIILSLNPPSEELSIGPSKILIGVYQPLYNKEGMYKWADNKLTVFSLDMLPRTTRAQSMDVLSSQANIAGYKAVL